MGGSEWHEHLAADPKISEGIRLILEGLQAAADQARSLSPDAYPRVVERIGERRGRPLFLPYVSSGFGRGARVRLADGRWALDLALGIGVHFFGHGDPDLVRTALVAAMSDTVMQGNLQLRMLERLIEEGFLGRDGRLERLAGRAAEGLDRLARDLGPGRIRGFEGLGTLWAIEPAGADHDRIVALVRDCFEAGLLLYYGGTGPYRLRLFLPGGALTDDDLDEAVGILRRCLARA